MSVNEFHCRKETQGPVDGALLQWISLLLLSSRKRIALQMIRHAKVVIEQCRLDGDGLDESNVNASGGISSTHSVHMATQMSRWTGSQDESQSQTASYSWRGCFHSGYMAGAFGAKEDCFCPAGTRKGGGCNTPPKHSAGVHGENTVGTVEAPHASFGLCVKI